MRYFDHIAVGDIPAHHPVALFNSLWRSLEKFSRPVRWGAVTPMEAAAALPWLLLLEPRPNGAYFYKICGTGCEALFGRPHEGRFFGEDIPAAAVEKRREEFNMIEAGAEPMFSATTLPMAGKENTDIYRGVFGFSTNSDTIDKIGIIVAPK